MRDYLGHDRFSSTEQYFLSRFSIGKDLNVVNFVGGPNRPLATFLTDFCVYNFAAAIPSASLRKEPGKADTRRPGVIG
jgi:hypothetical protein